tara:strand:- start:211 stop:519 length:309 start_codon:yes stop_codon:yes gene_type:complete
MMPRFEMHLLIVEKDDGEITSEESQIMCWVSNSNDMKEIQSVANSIIHDTIYDSDQTIMFGNAIIKVRGEEVMSLGFKNEELDTGEVDSVIDLITAEVETIH